MGAIVKGLSLEPNTKPNHFSLLNLDIETDFININNYSNLKKALIILNQKLYFI